MAIEVMKTILFLLIIIYVSNNALADETSLNEEVSTILGEIILYEDHLHRYGEKGSPGKPEQHMEMIEKGFKKIKAKYPENIQIDFLWSVMVRSSFGSQYVEEFVDLIRECCNSAYINALDSFLEQDRGYNMTITKKAKYIRHYLLERNRVYGEK